MSQPEPIPGASGRPAWRVGIVAPALSLLGQVLPLFLLLLPVPVAVLTDLRGWRAGVGWGLTAAAVPVFFRAAAFMGTGMAESSGLVVAGGALPLFAAGMGLAGGLAYRRDGHPALTYLAPGLFALGVVGTVWAVGRAALGVDAVAAAVGAWLAMMEAGLLPSLEAGGATVAQLEAWRQGLQEMARGIVVLFPAAFAVTAALWSMGVQWLTGRWLLVLGRPLRPGRPFVRWRFPWLLAWGYIVGQLLLLALRLGWTQGPDGTMLAVGLNLTFFFTYLFFMEGLAVVWYYLAKWGVGKGGRWIVTIFLVTPFLPLVEPVAWLGMLDAWLDFRKLQREGGP